MVDVQVDFIEGGNNQLDQGFYPVLVNAIFVNKTVP